MLDHAAIEAHRDPFLFDSRTDRPHRRPPLKNRRFTPRDKWHVHRADDGQWEAGPKAEHVFIDHGCHVRTVRFTNWHSAYTYAFFKSQEDV